MPMVRLRLIGSREDADSMIATLHGIEDIDHVEEVDDLMPQMRDDSSSSELIDDAEGNLYYLEVDTPTELLAEAVRGVAETLADERGLGLEFVDEF